MRSKGAEPRLRSFAPALVGFAVAGQWQRALDVEEKMKGMGLELQEEVRPKDLVCRGDMCVRSWAEEGFLNVSDCKILD